MKKKEKRKITTKTKIIGIIIILLLIIVSVFLAWKFLSPKEEKKEEYIKVPNLVGEESSTGQEVLEKLGFKVKIEETEDDSKEDMIGRIYKQSETGKVKKNTKIILSVYVSSEEVKMPDVVGMNKDEAKEILEKLGFNVVLEEKEDVEHENDIVISQKAANEDKIVRGSTIKLVYAKKTEEDSEEDKNQDDSNKKDDTPSSSNNSNTNDKETNSGSNNNGSNSNNNSSSGFNPDDAVDAVPDPVYKVTISGQKTHRIGYGPYKLTASVSPSLPSGKKIIWQSSNTSVATVSSTGVITPRATYGRATITATIEGTQYSGKMSITVLGVKGDLDGDGIINANDAAIALDYLYYGSNAVVNSVGDVNGDGVITQTDVDMIERYYLTGKW